MPATAAYLRFCGYSLPAVLWACYSLPAVLRVQCVPIVQVEVPAYVASGVVDADAVQGDQHAQRGKERGLLPRGVVGADRHRGRGDRAVLDVKLVVGEAVAVAIPRLGAEETVIARLVNLQRRGGGMQTLTIARLVDRYCTHG